MQLKGTPGASGPSPVFGIDADHGLLVTGEMHPRALLDIPGRGAIG